MVPAVHSFLSWKEISKVRLRVLMLYRRYNRVGRVKLQTTEPDLRRGLGVKGRTNFQSFARFCGSTAERKLHVLGGVYLCKSNDIGVPTLRNNEPRKAFVNESRNLYNSGNSTSCSRMTVIIVSVYEHASMAFDFSIWQDLYVKRS